MRPSMKEAEVRSVLARELQIRSSTPTRAIAEFWIPLSNERADLVLAGRLFEAFEIKSQTDDLLRLPRQVAAYGRVFNRCSAVLAERHLGSALPLLPLWWGVLAFPGCEGGFRIIREAGDNPDIDYRTLVRLLWKEEARAALVGLGLRLGHDEDRESMWDRLLSAAEPEQIRAIVRDALYRRDPGTARFGSRTLRRSFVVHEPAIALS